MPKSKPMAKHKLGMTGSKRSALTRNKKPLTVTNTQAPLQEQDSNYFKLKRCSIRLKRLLPPAQPTLTRVPKLFIETKHVANGVQKSSIKTKNVFEFCFDADTPPPIPENQGELQEIYKTMEIENRIILKKHKPKIGKQTKAAAKATEKNAAPKKQSNKLQPVIAASTEALRKKPNLKINTENDTVVAVNDQKTQLVTPNKENRDDLAKFTNNNLSIDALKSIEDPSSSSASKGKMVTRSTIKKSEEDIVLSKQKEDKENAAAVNRLRGARSKPNDQSTPKATPRSLATANKNGRNLADYSYFSNVSPLFNSTTRSVTSVDLQMQRLQLSTINDDTDHYDDAALVVDRNQDEGNDYNNGDNNSHESECSVLSTSNSGFKGFSPGTLRVYGLSSMKNITNEGNNLFASASFDKLGVSTISTSTTSDYDSPSKLRSSSEIVASAKQTPNKSSMPLTEVVLNEWRTKLTENGKTSNSDDAFLENIFGFDSDSEHDHHQNNMIPEKQTKENIATKTISDKNTLKEARAKLKRFLIHPEPQGKQVKNNNNQMNNDNQNNLALKEKMQNIFETSSKITQKDIRTVVQEASAASATLINTNDCKEQKIEVVSGNAVESKSKERSLTTEQFEELQSVPQDMRKSYSRPARKYRKRRVPIDSDHEDDKNKDDRGDGTAKNHRNKNAKID